MPYYQPYPATNYLPSNAVMPGYYIVAAPAYRPVAEMNPEYLPAQTPFAAQPQPTFVVQPGGPMEYPTYRPVAPPPNFGFPYLKNKKSIKH
ncbi:hypothetical protein FO519_006403 [Halicephalobus sp. NKZ332]|nr:hypothetical protein FO519_006403 [Halicephalobus sp. NKZ332]